MNGRPVKSIEHFVKGENAGELPKSGRRKTCLCG